MTLGTIDRRLAKLRAHTRTPRGRRDFAAVAKIVDLLAQRDKADWHGRRDVTELLKVIYPADSIYPTGVPLRALPYPMLALLRKA